MEVVVDSEEMLSKWDVVASVKCKTRVMSCGSQLCFRCTYLYLNVIINMVHDHNSPAKMLYMLVQGHRENFRTKFPAHIIIKRTEADLEAIVMNSIHFIKDINSIAVMRKSKNAYCF